MRKMYNLPAKWIWFNNITGYLFRLKLTQIITKGKEIIQILSGITPLKLSNAVSKNIINLIQYGKVIQNGTPTPEAPVALVCNNGVLKIVDDELPIGYKRITGIKFDGDFWYETGEALTGDDDVTITLDDTVPSGQNVFGSYNGTASGKKNFSLYIYGGSSTSSSYLRYGEQLVRPKLGSGLRTITFGKSGTSGFQTDVTVTPEDFITPANACIGMLPNSSSPAYTGSIIGNILVGTRLKWIPCERERDGVVGYYEAIEGNFLEPTGTGTPVAGNYDTSHLTKLEVVGTPEVLTISANGTTQTASVVDLFATDSVADEQDIISGVVTRRTEVSVSDGVITISALAEPYTEQATPQPLNTTDGVNIVSVESAVAPVELSVKYYTNK